MTTAEQHAADARATPEAEPEAAAPTTLFGLRRSALVELALFFLLCLLVDVAFGNGDRFWNVAPHPFWAIVLLVSVQYGTSEGLVAALAATAVLFTGEVPQQRLDQDYHEYLLVLSARPLMWFIAAVVFGEMRMREVRRQAQLQRQLRLVGEREVVLSDAYRRLRSAKENLEVRVAGQLRTVFSLHQAAKAIEQLGLGEVLIGIAGLVREVLAPRKFSVYLLNHNVLEAVINEGWGGEDAYDYARVFDSSSPIFQQVVAHQNFLCVIDPEQQRTLGHEGLMAGPLVSVETGEVMGMLKIEDMGFLELHLSSFENFRILCQWIGTAFAKAERYEELEQESVFNPEHNLMSAGFYERQTAFLKHLARRTGFALTSVILRVDAEDLREHHRLPVSNAVSEAVTSSLRTTDLAFDHRRSGWEFAVLLPATSPDGAQIVADKLLAAVRAKLPAEAADVQIATSVQVLHNVDDSGRRAAQAG